MEAGCIGRNMTSEILALIWGFEGFEDTLSLSDLCSLSATRKDWQGQITSVYGGERAQKLVQAIVECVPGLKKQLVDKKLTTDDMTPSKLLQQLWTVVSFMKAEQHWVRAVAATPGLTGDCNQLLQVPRLPYNVAKHFVQQLGVRISYQQLLTAAHNKIAGVEVWVQVQHELGIETDMPDIATTICVTIVKKQQMDEVLATTPEECVNILKLAFNSSNSGWQSNAAAAADSLLPYVTNTAVLEHLLETAILRKHIAVLKSAVQLEAVKNLKLASVLRLMEAAADTGTGVRPDISPLYDRHLLLWGRTTQPAESMMDHLVRIPAAAAISSANLVNLMQTAVAHGSSGEASAWALCTLQPATNWTKEELLPVLQQAVAKHCAAGVQSLSSLPAANSLTAEDLRHLLETAIEAKCCAALVTLCKLSAAENITVDECIGLMQSAIAQKVASSMQDLCSLSAASTISVVAWSDLLTSAMQKSPADSTSSGVLIVRSSNGSHTIDEHSWTPLCDLPAAKRASSAVVAELLAVGITHDRPSEIKSLCSLPAAAAIPQQQVLQLVRDVVFRAASSCAAYNAAAILQAMQQLSTVQCMQTAELVEMVRMLVQQDGSDVAVVSWFSRLAAARNVPADTMTELLLRATQQEKCSLHMALCEFPAAAALDADAFLLLFAAAANEDRYSAISTKMQQQLCSLPAAYKLSSSQLMGVMFRMISSNHTLVDGLSRVPAAQQLTDVDMTTLFHSAIRSNNIINVKRLCCLPAASNISSSSMAELLSAAVALNSCTMVSALCELEPSAQLDASQLQPVLKAALNQGDGDTVRTLCSLSAAHSIPLDALLANLVAATSTSSVVAVHSLCQLRSAADVDDATASQLLQTAVEMHNSSVVTSLGQLTAVRQIPAKALAALISLAEKKGNQHVARALRRL